MLTQSRIALREALATALAQPVGTALTLLIVAVVAIAGMVTTGRSVAAEEDVLASIDSVGTRTITVRAESDAGVTTELLDRLQNIDGIEWTIGLTSSQDATNALLDGGGKVAVRSAYSSDFGVLNVPPTTSPARVIASESALRTLGLPDGVGGIVLDDGAEHAITGPIEVPAQLTSYEPLAIIPNAPPDKPARLTTVVVVAERPDLVAPVSAVVRSLVGSQDPSLVAVETSERLADLRIQVGEQLGSFSRGLLLTVLAAGSLIVAFTLLGLVAMRRRDFGRQRALGATRGFIITVLVLRTCITASAGSAIGLGTGLGVLLATGGALPNPSFVVAVAILSILTPTFAAVVPALIASRRDPAKELRVA